MGVRVYDGGFAAVRSDLTVLGWAAVRIACIGGGPAGLYFSILAKRANPAHKITLYERNRPDDTFGFGVVFSDATMDFLAQQDRRTHRELTRRATRWDSFTVIHRGRVDRVRGVGFSAIERRQLLFVLQQQARDLGVELLFQHEVSDPLAHLTADLVIGSDGVNSAVRNSLARYLRPHVEVGPTHFSWLGTDRRFDSLTFFFEANEHGCFGAHVYPFAPDRATFIVETDTETYQRAGAATFTDADTTAYCERLFAGRLGGHRLLSNRSLWQQFRTVRCATWHHENVVLIGDAAHTAHFSVVSVSW